MSRICLALVICCYLVQFDVAVANPDVKIPILPLPIIKPGPCCKACPAIYKPVCASNGHCFKTFGSECQLKNHGCNTKADHRRFFVVSHKQCENSKLHPLCKGTKVCKNTCTKINKPICATNGICHKTFANKCLLDVHNCNNPLNAFVETRTGECGLCETPKCT